MATCRKCGKRAKLLPQRRICQACHSEYHREYARRNRERIRKLNSSYDQRKRQGDPEWVESQRKRGREYWARIRHEVIEAYGGYRCACCGETEPKFLTLDHVFNDGAKHRRAIGYKGNGKGASTATLQWLRRHNFPAGFQVLCMNCNMGKQRNGGVCPHQTASLRKKTA